LRGIEKHKEHVHTSPHHFIAVRTIGIDLGKNSFHLVGLDQRGAIVLQLKCPRAQLERRLANIPSCLIGMETRVAVSFFAIGACTYRSRFH
jgi:hypothetical protein